MQRNVLAYDHVCSRHLRQIVERVFIQIGDNALIDRLERSGWPAAMEELVLPRRLIRYDLHTQLIIHSRLSRQRIHLHRIERDRDHAKISHHHRLAHLGHYRRIPCIPGIQFLIAHETSVVNILLPLDGKRRDAVLKMI